MRTDRTYEALLKDELTDAETRLARADPEGAPVINEQIREILRDIARYSENAEKSS